eukprot:m.234379 g.234379  ORF g.234379 m.234379 type:complete len:292 (-) comp19586_c0_seq1:28-903(-)
MARFEDSFWGVDPINFTGFENLCEIMKNGKRTCDDLQAFMKARIQIEDTYAKSLLRLAKISCAAAPTGTLHEAWRQMRAETERIAANHARLATELEAHVEGPVKQFRERQRDQRKKIEETVRRAQKYKVSSFEKNTKCRKTYDQRCRESEKVKEELKACGQSQPSKELDKIRARVLKAEQAVDQANTQYQEAITQLEDSRIQWEREMERCGSVFQLMEEERLIYLRNVMWLATNIFASACVTDDEAFETMRVQLEHVSVEADIAEYIREKRTGSQRPARIEFIKYVGDSQH